MPLPSVYVHNRVQAEHWCIQFSICHYWLYTLWFCWPSDILVGKHPMTIKLNPTTRHQTLWRSIYLETDIITCSHSAEIDNSAFSDACKPYPFLCNTSKKVIVMWLLICKHYIAIASSQSGVGLITFLYTKHAHEHFELIIHAELQI